MDQNPVGETGASPAPQTSEAKPTTNALAGKSVEELAKGLVDKRESKKHSSDRKKVDANNNLAESGEEQSEPANAGEESQDAPTEKKENKNPNSRELKRISVLTGQRNELREQVKALRQELEEFKAGNQIYHEELERISKLARLDPQTEAQRRAELETRSQQLQEQIRNSVEEEYSKGTIDQQVEAEAHEMYEEMQEAAAEWDGVFSTIELGYFMRQNNNFDVKAAARELGMQREAKIAAKLKRTQAQAPATANMGSSGAGQSASSRKIPTSAEDIDKWIRNKTGR